MEELNTDNILSGDFINSLFDNDSTEDTKDEESNSSNEEEVVNVDNLFDSNASEDVDTQKYDNTNTSNNVYTSLVEAFVEDGIFTGIEEEDIKNINTPELFAEAIEKVIASKLDEKQKRISEALDNNVDADEIKEYENVLSFLSSVDESDIKDESDRGVNLRKQLIYQDFLNRGYSKERAEREVSKSFKSGSDIEDALESLSSNKDYYKTSYDNILNEAKEAKLQKDKQRDEEIKAFKSSILEDKKFFGDYEVDKKTREKIYDNVTKAIYKDPNTGELLTALQKYERDNKTEFIKNLGLVYTITDGFRNFNGLLKNEVKKEVRKGIRGLESKLNNTARNFDGNLNFVSGISEDSFIGSGWNIAD